MNKEEKLYILDKCIEKLHKALTATELTTKHYYLNQGIALKDIIEKLIDCQKNPYYLKYHAIVNYYQALVY